MKLMGNQVVNGILGNSIDYENINKLTADAKLEKGDVKATIAAISFILTSSAKHGIDEESLSNELQQLGLPKESTAALCRIFSVKFSLLQEKLKNDSFKLTEVKKIDWQVDHILYSSFLKSDVNNPSVKLSFEVKENDEMTLQSINMSSSKFQTLLHELKQACAIMEETTPSS
ncbi:unnamed protein product [Larinioides sclopetarius]